ncbi:alpha/beta hydrolase [Burkholderia contaminans]|uniref:alpha/beta hydrolase n=1 Tax=Burkholderia contaminans TaxID=488447 RepID=UPI001ABAE79F|nr:alpha/beta fold hydrolase [Burkholderia contaminans]
MNPETRTDTVVLIHGLWMTPLSWEHWVTRYEQRGMRVITPGYPGVQPGTAGVEALRRDPSPLVNLGVREIFDHLARTIAALDTKPIIMGHSFGGAFAQLLLDAGYGSAGVSIDGAAVKGVWALPFSQIKAAFPVLRNPANLHRAVPITEKEFHYAFTNNLSLEESKKVYDRYAVPVSGRILFQGAFANVNPNAPDALQLRERRSRTAALCRRRQRQHPAAGRTAREFRKECEWFACNLGVQTVRRPQPLHLWRARLGGGCRLRTRLGARACAGRSRQALSCRSMARSRTVSFNVNSPLNDLSA